MRHVILGNGPAGVIAAETIRKHAPAGPLPRITCLMSASALTRGAALGEPPHPRPYPLRALRRARRGRAAAGAPVRA